MADDFDNHWDRDAAYEHERDLHREPTFERDAYRAHLIGPARCSAADHIAIKSDPARWSQLKHIGDQHIAADDAGPAERIELRNCNVCHSTLALSFEVAP